jgi:hypothetical protein
VENAILDLQTAGQGQCGRTRAADFPVLLSVGGFFEQQPRAHHAGFMQYQRPEQERAEVQANVDALCARHRRLSAPGRVANRQIIGGQQRPGRQRDAKIPLDPDRPSDFRGEIAR